MLLPPKHTFQENMYEFNQHGLDESGCTYIAIITAIANNHWLHITDDIIKDLLKNRPKIAIWSGSNLWRACQFALQDINRMFNKNLTIHKIDLANADQYMKMWWMILVQGKINYDYVKDIKDWVLDNAFVIKFQDEQHARCLHEMNNIVCITENFKWILPYNTFPVRDRKDLIAKKVLLREAFIIA